MIHNFYGGVVYSAEYKERGTRGVYRVIETMTEIGCKYSVFAVSICGEVCDDAFAFDVTEDIGEAVGICDYLCNMRVGAIHLLEVLEDNIGSGESDAFRGI